jgi:hypothetical protein
MKINELVGVKSQLQDREQRFRIEDRLRQQGFVKIGEGGYGSVFSHPKLNYVLKLFDSSDSPYLNFVNFATQNKNPHFPVFRGKPIQLSSLTNAIRMEKLQPWKINYSSPIDQGLENIMGLLATSSDWKDEIASMSREDREPIVLLFKKFPQMLTAIKLMDKFQSMEPDANWDLHEGNVMRRGDTFVFTDPFSD